MCYTLSLFLPAVRYLPTYVSHGFLWFLCLSTIRRTMVDL